MTKRVIDLTPSDLDRDAAEAWDAAAREALAQGHAVTGSRNGRRYRCYPDGRVEDLGLISETAADGPGTVAKARQRQAVAD